jgi:hypothetical protein
MNKTTKRVLLWSIGGLTLLMVVAISFLAYMAMSLFESTKVDQQGATAAFEDVRKKFAEGPAFIIEDMRATKRREPPSTRPQAATNLHILSWNADEGEIARIRLPFSLLRLGGDKKMDIEGVNLNWSDVERYGSTLLLDADTPDGDHVVLWTE